MIEGIWKKIPDVSVGSVAESIAGNSWAAEFGQKQPPELQEIKLPTRTQSRNLVVDDLIGVIDSYGQKNLPRIADKRVCTNRLQSLSPLTVQQLRSIESVVNLVATEP